MEIVHISAECYPVAKVGGLADVVGALPMYQNAIGCQSFVVMPFYDILFTQKNTFKKVYDATLKFGKEIIDFNVLTLKENSLDFDIFYIDIPGLLDKNYVYSENDTDRFLAFQIAALDWILQRENTPKVIHCHDHHTGLIPFMLSQSYEYKSLRNIPTVLTIHNAQYQGWFSHEKVDLIPEFDFSNVGLLDWNQTINPLAAGIKCAWKVITVSPSYMEELKLKANGLEDLLNHESAKCAGILNGIDWKVWNPETDTHIPYNYSINDLSGKLKNKKYLLEHFKMPFNEKAPLVGIISRMVAHKGFDIFAEAVNELMTLNAQCIIL